MFPRSRVRRLEGPTANFALAFGSFFECCWGDTTTGRFIFPFPEGFTIEKALPFFGFFFFFYHLGQEAVWFDIGSNFIFKQNMRNTGEETTLCSLELVEEKTGLQKYSLMHTLDEHVPWLTQH